MTHLPNDLKTMKKRIRAWRLVARTARTSFMTATILGILCVICYIIFIYPCRIGVARPLARAQSPAPGRALSQECSH